MFTFVNTRTTYITLESLWLCNVAAPYKHIVLAEPCNQLIWRQCFTAILSVYLPIDGITEQQPTSYLQNLGVSSCSSLWRITSNKRNSRRAISNACEYPPWKNSTCVSPYFASKSRKNWAATVRPSRRCVLVDWRLEEEVEEVMEGRVNKRAGRHGWS